MAKAKKTDVILVEVQATLEIELGKSERDEKANLASELYDRVQKGEAEIKLQTKVAKAKIKPLKDELEKCVAAVLTGKEKRVVNAKRAFDPVGKLTWLVYQQRRYEERDMSAYEIAQARERGIFGDHPGLAVVPIAKAVGDHPKRKSGKDVAGDQGEDGDGDGD